MQHSTPTPRKRQLNEVRDIHPLVALWLTQNGYSYIHEYRLPDYGIVDFYATHSDGHILLVEAKGERFSKVIAQLATYGNQIPSARLAIAVSEISITPKLEMLATKYNMFIIPLDTSKLTESPSNGSSANLSLLCSWERLNFIEALVKDPYSAMLPLLESNQSAITKIMNLWFAHELVGLYCETVGKEDTTTGFFVATCLDIASDMNNLSEYPYLYDMTKSILINGDAMFMIRNMWLGWDIPMELLLKGMRSKQ